MSFKKNDINIASADAIFPENGHTFQIHDAI